VIDIFLTSDSSSDSEKILPLCYPVISKLTSFAKSLVEKRTSLMSWRSQYLQGAYS